MKVPGEPKWSCRLFKDYQGAIQTDGYAGYNILEKLEGITTLGCWVHTRRYFDRALSHDKARAEYALAQIGMLYDVESMADDQHMDTLQRMEPEEAACLSHHTRF